MSDLEIVERTRPADEEAVGPVKTFGCPHLPARFFEAGVSFDRLDLSVGSGFVTALAAARSIVDGEIKGLLLCGPVGCGKSHLSAAACNEEATRLQRAIAAAQDAALELRDAVAAGTPGGHGPELNDANATLQLQERRAERNCPRWISVPNVLVALRREMGSDSRPAVRIVEAATKTPGLLVLDDLGLEKASDWTVETVSQIVCARYDDDLRTIVTSNRTAQQLAEAGYDRVVSRLADNGMLVELASLATTA